MPKFYAFGGMMVQVPLVYITRCDFQERLLHLLFNTVCVRGNTPTYVFLPTFKENGTAFQRFNLLSNRSFFLFWLFLTSIYYSAPTVYSYNFSFSRQFYFLDFILYSGPASGSAHVLLRLWADSWYSSAVRTYFWSFARHINCLYGRNLWWLRFKIGPWVFYAHFRLPRPLPVSVNLPFEAVLPNFLYVPVPVLSVSTVLYPYDTAHVLYNISGFNSR